MTLIAEHGHTQLSSSTETEWSSHLRTGLAETHKFEFDDPVGSGASTGIVLSDSPQTYMYRTGPLYNEMSTTEPPLNIRYFIYPVEPSSTTILVDFSDPESLIEPENPQYLEIVEQLRSGGREVVAEELIELLHDLQEEGEEINTYSLQAMARFLIKNREFADPIFGPDPGRRYHPGRMAHLWRWLASSGIP